MTEDSVCSSFQQVGPSRLVPAVDFKVLGILVACPSSSRFPKVLYVSVANWSHGCSLGNANDTLCRCRFWLVIWPNPNPNPSCKARLGIGIEL